MSDTIPGYESLIEQANGSERMVVVERDGPRAVVTLDDPERLNPLSAALTLQLQEALGELTADPGVRVVTLTGRDPAFSAGGDLRMMREVGIRLAEESPAGTTAAWRWIRRQFGGIARIIAGSDTTFIAAVNGAAAGVGLAFALACDLVLVSERARLVPAFGRIGLLPEVGTSWQLTRRLGYQGTFALFASGHHLSGAEAVELGIANEVHPHEALLDAAHGWAERIAALPEHVPAMTKTLLRQCASMSWEQAIAMEEFAEPNCFTTRAHRAAVEELLASS